MRAGQVRLLRLDAVRGTLDAHYTPGSHLALSNTSQPRPCAFYALPSQLLGARARAQTNYANGRAPALRPSPPVFSPLLAARAPLDTTAVAGSCLSAISYSCGGSVAGVRVRVWTRPR